MSEVDEFTALLRRMGVEHQFVPADSSWLTSEELALSPFSVVMVSQAVFLFDAAGKFIAVTGDEIHELELRKDNR